MSHLAVKFLCYVTKVSLFIWMLKDAAEGRHAQCTKLLSSAFVGNLWGLHLTPGSLQPYVATVLVSTFSRKPRSADERQLSYWPFMPGYWNRVCSLCSLLHAVLFYLQCMNCFIVFYILYFLMSCSLNISMLGTVLRARTRGASISAVFAAMADAPAGRNPGRLTQTGPKKDLHDTIIWLIF